MTQTDLELKIMNTMPYPAKRMINDVCVNLQIPWSKIKQGERYPENIVARRIIAYFLREKYGYTFEKIGRTLGKDHSTILYHYRWIKDRINEIDSIYEYKKIFNLINSKYD